jgi:hypothetical protein
MHDDPHARYQPQPGRRPQPDQRYQSDQPARRYQPAQRYQEPPPPPRLRESPPQRVREYSLRGAEVFWYVLGCIPMGAAYFAKIPVKKAFYEVLDDLRADVNPRLGGAEAFWYVLMCIAFGGGYFAKVSAKKGLCEIVTMLSARGGPEAAVEALRGRNGQRQTRGIR